MVGEGRVGENFSLKSRRLLQCKRCQKEIDHLFKTLVLPILTYGLAVYGASDSDLNVIQLFLDTRLCSKENGREPSALKL